MKRNIVMIVMAIILSIASVVGATSLATKSEYKKKDYKDIDAKFIEINKLIDEVEADLNANGEYISKLETSIKAYAETEQKKLDEAAKKEAEASRRNRNSGSSSNHSGNSGGSSGNRGNSASGNKTADGGWKTIVCEGEDPVENHCQTCDLVYHDRGLCPNGCQDGIKR